MPPATVVAPTAAPTACNGRLDVQAIPVGAAISIDGRAVGQAPLLLPVSPGSHIVDLQADGYATYRLTVEVVCGKVEVLQPQLYDNAAPVLEVDPVPQSVAPDDGLKVTATSSDNHAIANMALYVDGRLIYQLERDRLRHNLDTRALAIGPHVLRVLATDVAGNVQERTIAFSVAPGSEPAGEAMNLATATPTHAPTAPPALPVASPTQTAIQVSTPLPTSTPAPTALPAVAVYEEQLTLALYDYGPALYVNEGAGHPYPLLHHDQV
ncbi:MAG: PEGA domain-containing protein, partial [Anaerolineae bacterium]